MLDHSFIFERFKHFPNSGAVDYNRTDELRLCENSPNLHNLEIISLACIISPPDIEICPPLDIENSSRALVEAAEEKSEKSLLLKEILIGPQPFKRLQSFILAPKKDV